MVFTFRNEELSQASCHYK